MDYTVIITLKSGEKIQVKHYDASSAEAAAHRIATMDNSDKLMAIPDGNDCTTFLRLSEVAAIEIKRNTL
ncbi:MAG: hypothetical protein ACOX63_10125 [Christensenellales bacterium]|jgi:hypothetical protein